MSTHTVCLAAIALAGLRKSSGRRTVATSLTITLPCSDAIEAWMVHS